MGSLNLNHNRHRRHLLLYTLCNQLFNLAWCMFTTVFIFPSNPLYFLVLLETVYKFTIYLFTGIMITSVLVLRKYILFSVAYRIVIPHYLISLLCLPNILTIPMYLERGKHLSCLHINYTINLGSSLYLPSSALFFGGGGEGGERKKGSL